MTVKIAKKIKGYSVAKPDKGAAAPAAGTAAPPPRGAEVIQMHERLERPEVLVGSTYKVKSPLFEHALYVTLNDIVLNQGTEYESRRPFEIFINSKNMDHFQWIVALTRIMSAVFRKGGDVTFLVEEMKAVFDPRGGYFKAGGVYMSSIVAEIGAVIEDHMKMIGLIVDEEPSPEQRRLIAEKRKAYEASLKKKSDLSPDLAGAAGESARKPARGDRAERRRSCEAAEPGEPRTGAAETLEVTGEGTRYPPSATLCHKCSTRAVVILDGCATCLACGYSKCG